MVGGAVVRPDVCPQPTAGATVRLVCTFSSPLLGGDSLWGGVAHLGYLHTARLVVLGIWRISWGGSARCTGAGGAGSARFSFGDLLWEGPCGTGRESDPLERRIRRSTALGVCAVQVPWQDLVPFGILAGGWAREMAVASAFVPRQAELCRPGLNNSPSRCPPALPFSKQNC